MEFQDSTSSDTGSIDSLRYSPSRPQLQRSITISSISVKTEALEDRISHIHYNGTKPIETSATPEQGTSIKENISCDSNQSVSPSKSAETKTYQPKESPDEAKEATTSDSDGKSINAARDSTTEINEATTVGTKNESNESKLPVINVDDHNRTMVLQVGRVDMRLISPDRKQVLLHKFNRDVSTCVQVSKSSKIGECFLQQRCFCRV